jgi:hypothetical protein
MAKVPLVPHNALLRTFIRSIEEPDNTEPTVSFVSIQFKRPEFQIWVDSSTLRDAAKLALNADLLCWRFVKKNKGLRKFLPKVKVHAKMLVATRDQLYEDYEFLRTLIANDNFAISLRKTTI